MSPWRQDLLRPKNGLGSVCSVRPGTPAKKCLTIRVTKCVCEKVAQNIAQPTFVKNYTKFLSWKKKPKTRATSVIFNKTEHSKE
jgi:hypothetical protein